MPKNKRRNRFQKSTERSKRDIENSIPGFGRAADVHARIPEFEGDHKVEFKRLAKNLQEFVSARDPVALLSLVGRQHLFESASKDEDDTNALQQATVELLQTLSLTVKQRPQVPTSPSNYQRCKELLDQCLDHFAASSRPEDDSDIEALLAHQFRVQTLYYRNAFSSDVAEILVPALLEKIDELSVTTVGYRLSDLARAFFEILRQIGQRFDEMAVTLKEIFEGRDVREHLAELANRSAMAASVMRRTKGWFAVNGWRSDAAFQLSEMGWSQAFMFSRTELVELFGEAIAEVLFELAISPGELSELDLERAFLTSPIRQRPFVLPDRDQLFVPTPGLMVSFVFEILEGIMRPYPHLLEAYSRARSNYLPEALEALVSEALPSASVYREVTWRDPDSNAQYENDLLAVIGHQVFVFEAKSGKLKPAARRGGIDSIKKNLKELFVEPARQAARLEQLLQTGRFKHGDLVDRTGREVVIDMGRPVIISKFGVCLEHFAGLTSTRENYVRLGLLSKADGFAPILSLGEFHMIGAHLDSEPAYFHYLSRRQTIEQQFEFMGDEQDLLSIYLTNRFFMDEEALKGTRVMFLGADKPSRQLKSSNPNRRRFDMPGFKLPHVWQRIGAEIYESGIQHRFDMLEVMLNQNPADLVGLAQRATRWNRRTSVKEDTAFVSRTIGMRTFGLALCHIRQPPLSGVALGLLSREVLQMIPGAEQLTDFLLVVRSQKRPGATFDGVHFARLLRRSTAEARFSESTFG